MKLDFPDTPMVGDFATLYQEDIRPDELNRLHLPCHVLSVLVWCAVKPIKQRCEPRQRCVRMLLFCGARRLQDLPYFGPL
jgi:hypothetical protein